MINKFEWVKKIFMSQIARIILIIVIWAIALNILAVFGSKIIPMDGINPHKRFAVIDHWFYFDAGFYSGIATQGYREPPETNAFGENFARAAFFPAYPVLAKYFSKILFLDIRNSMLFINFLLTIGAGIFIFKIAEHFSKDDNQALKTVVYFLVFPFTFFMIAPYSEAVFIFFISVGLYLLFKKNYLWAGIMGIGITASRFIGIIFPILMIMYFLESNNWNFKKINLKIIIYALIPFVGLGLYMLYLNKEFSNPLYFYEMQKLWRNEFEPNIIKTVYDCTKEAITQGFDYKLYSEVASLFVFSILGLLAIKKTNITFAAYVFVSLLVPLLTGTVHSINRFMVPLIPCFIVLGFLGKNKIFDFTYLYICILFQALFVIMFTHAIWVG